MSNTAFIAMLSRLCRLTASYRRDPDRRATCRFHVEEGAVPATIRAPAFAIRGTLRNISSSGAQIATGTPLPANTRITVTFTVGDQDHHHPACVVRSQREFDRYVVNIRFAPGPFERLLPDDD